MSNRQQNLQALTEIIWDRAWLNVLSHCPGGLGWRALAQRLEARDEDVSAALTRLAAAEKVTGDRGVYQVVN